MADVSEQGLHGSQELDEGSVGRGQHGAEADNSGLVQNSAWELSYLPLAGGAEDFLCEIRSERCFPLVVRLPPPSRRFPAQRLSLHLQTWHNLLPEELDVFLRAQAHSPPPTSRFKCCYRVSPLNDILFLRFQ